MTNDAHNQLRDEALDALAIAFTGDVNAGQRILALGNAAHKLGMAVLWWCDCGGAKPLEPIDTLSVRQLSEEVAAHLENAHRKGPSMCSAEKLWGFMKCYNWQKHQLAPAVTVEAFPCGVLVVQQLFEHFFGVWPCTENGLLPTSRSPWHPKYLKDDDLDKWILQRFECKMREICSDDEYGFVDAVGFAATYSVLDSATVRRIECYETWLRLATPIEDLLWDRVIDSPSAEAADGIITLCVHECYKNVKTFITNEAWGARKAGAAASENDVLLAILSLQRHYARWSVNEGEAA